jgi:hypothetical protein
MNHPDMCHTGDYAERGIWELDGYQVEYVVDRASYAVKVPAQTIETLSPAVVHWSLDGWQSVDDLGSKDSGLGIYFTDLDTARLKPGAKVDFTFYWPDGDRWEGTNYTVEVESVA